MTTTSPETVRHAWPLRLGAVAAAAVVNVLIGLLAPLLGVDMIIEPQGQEPVPVPVAAFAGFTTAFGLIGWGTFALAERFLGARGPLVWTVVAVLFTLVSFVPSMSVNAGPATEAVLLFSHVVVAAILIPVFWRTSRAA